MGNGSTVDRPPPPAHGLAWPSIIMTSRPGSMVCVGLGGVRPLRVARHTHWL